MKGTTNRGFAIYEEFVDERGATVEVVESSQATIEGEDRGPWLWIFAKGGALDTDGSIYLAPALAERLRDALDEWIESEKEPARPGLWVGDRQVPRWGVPIVGVLAIPALGVMLFALGIVVAALGVVFGALVFAAPAMAVAWLLSRVGPRRDG